MLGMFIEANLVNLKMSPQQFAKEMDIDPFSQTPSSRDFARVGN
jgi:hypothetical protein